ncbi:MAG: orotidine-5'-phosphate decarboxylase [bacterium]
MSTRTGSRTSLPLRERVAVALDVETARDALAVRDLLGEEAGLLKLGSALFVREGLPLVTALAAGGAKVFLDLKFHDIPSVVGKAVEKACAGGVSYVTVHASGGRAMIEAAVRAAEQAGNGTRVLGVTVLTSLDLASWRESASPGEQSVEAAVARLAALAVDGGAHGLVGSAREAALLRQIGGRAAVIVTPGIRIPGVESRDQARTVGAEEAARSGADILVVGRGVVESKDPKEALRTIHRALEEATS